MKGSVCCGQSSESLKYILQKLQARCAVLVSCQCLCDDPGQWRCVPKTGPLSMALRFARQWLPHLLHRLLHADVHHALHNNFAATANSRPGTRRGIEGMFVDSGPKSSGRSTLGS
eukprot:5614699-Amphidinium_carterae.1